MKQTDYNAMSTMMRSMEVDELTELYQMVWEEKKHRMVMKSCLFNEGETVKVEGLKSGSWIGTILKINKKNIKVRNNETKTIWNCNPVFVHKFIAS